MTRPRFVVGEVGWEAGEEVVVGGGGGGDEGVGDSPQYWIK